MKGAFERTPNYRLVKYPIHVKHNIVLGEPAIHVDYFYRWKKKFLFFWIDAIHGISYSSIQEAEEAFDLYFLQRDNDKRIVKEFYRN